LLPGRFSGTLSLWPIGHRPNRQERRRHEMIVAEQQFARSEMALRQTGYMALIQSLGYADAIRFLLQLSTGEGDYLEWQERHFGDASVDELYEQAQEYW
jgi:hypothetical protein